MPQKKTLSSETSGSKSEGIIILALLIVSVGYHTFFTDKKTGTGKARRLFSKNAKRNR